MSMSGDMSAAEYLEWMLSLNGLIKDGVLDTSDTARVGAAVITSIVLYQYRELERVQAWRKQREGSSDALMGYNLAKLYGRRTTSVEISDDELKELLPVIAPKSIFLKAVKAGRAMMKAIDERTDIPKQCKKKARCSAFTRYRYDDFAMFAYLAAESLILSYSGDDHTITIKYVADGTNPVIEAYAAETYEPPADQKGGKMDAAERAAGVVEAEKHVYSKPEKAVFPTSKLAQQGTLQELMAHPRHVTEINVGGSGKGKAAIRAGLYLDDGLKNEIEAAYNDPAITIKGGEITPWQKSVFNAICAIREAGNDGFTIQELADVLAGGRKTSIREGSIRAKNKIYRYRRRDDLRNAVEGLRCYRIFIDATEQIEKHHGGELPKGLKGGGWNGQFLPVVYTWLKLPNGEIVDGYKFLGPGIIADPPLLAYSKAVKQIISAPMEELRLETISSTQDTIPLRDCLFQRIKGMMNEKNKLQSNKIRYDAAAGEAGIDYTNQSARMKAHSRKQIKTMLDEWTAKNVIAGWEEYKNGRTPTGVAIKLPVRKKS